MVAFNVPVHGLCHVVGGLACAVFFLVQHIAVEVQLAEEGLIDVFIGDYQVTRADVEFLREFLGGLEFMDDRFDGKQFHAVYLPFSFLIFGGRAFAGKDGTDLGIVSSIFPFSRREMSAHRGVDSSPVGGAFPNQQGQTDCLISSSLFCLQP